MLTAVCWTGAEAADQGQAHERGSRGDLERLRRDLVIRRGGMTFLAAGMIIAAMRYLPPPP